MVNGNEFLDIEQTFDFIDCVMDTIENDIDFMDNSIDDILED